MRRRAFYFVCLFSTLLTIAPVVRAAEPALSATAVVEKLHGALLQTMKGGPKMTFAARVGLLEPVVREAYDLPGIARVATGAAWQKMSKDEQAQVIDAFTGWTVATYASQFKAYDGEKFVTKGESDAERGRKSVDTQLAPKGDEPTEFVYKLRDDEGHWRIIDVYVDGTIDQLAQYRSQFAAVLAKGGVSGLIADMKTQAAQLAKSG